MTTERTALGSPVRARTITVRTRLRGLFHMHVSEPAQKRAGNREVFFRTGRVLVERATEDDRTVEFSISSEAAVERYGYIETLVHTSEAVRLDYLRQVGALLMDHNWRDQVGAIQRVEPKDGKLRARAKFSRSQRGFEVWRDVQDGVRRGVSIGYVIHRTEERKREDGVLEVRVVDWEPLEVSLVSVPADASVGVGRSHPTEGNPMDSQDTMTRSEKREAGRAAKEAERLAADAREDERARVSTIRQLAELNDLGQLGDEAIRNGASIADFKAQIRDANDTESVTVSRLDGRYFDGGEYGDEEAPTTSMRALGVTNKERRRYSLSRLVDALFDQKARRHAGFELEVHAALEDRFGSRAGGTMIPLEAMLPHRRGMSTAPTAGAAMIPDFIDSWIDTLAETSRVVAAGIRTMPVERGTYSIPRFGSGFQGEFVAEGADGSEETPVVSSVHVEPHTMLTWTSVTRKLMKSSPDLEQFVRIDMLRALGKLVDQAVLAGDGLTAWPAGILSTAGITDIDGSGGADFALVMALIESIADAEAEDGNRLGFITASRVRSALLQTPQIPGVGPAVWAGATGKGAVAGVPAYVTARWPSDLTTDALVYGNWEDAALVSWGPVEVDIDFGGSQFSKGGAALRAIGDIDVAVRHPESFAVGSGIPRP